MYRSGSDTWFYDKCSAVRALCVYLRPRFSLHRTENNITLRPPKCRYHSDMEFSVCRRCINPEIDTVFKCRRLSSIMCLQTSVFRYNNPRTVITFIFFFMGIDVDGTRKNDPRKNDPREKWFLEKWSTEK